MGRLASKKIDEAEMKLWLVPFARRAWIIALAALPLLGQGPASGPPDGWPRQYTVLLEAPSSGQRLARQRDKSDGRGPARVAKSGFEALGRSVERSQGPVIEALRAGGGTVLGSVQNVLNAVFVLAGPAQAKAFERIPGVRRVVPSRVVPLDLEGVKQVVGLDALTVRDPGATGEGVSIAVIDSGLDFGHPAFKDATLARLAGFPKGRPMDLALASPKIVAVRSYQHLQNVRDPAVSAPDDPTAWDFEGHGTAVAMIAAGAEVQSPAGLTSGIAPKAYLGIYKVSGSHAIVPGGSTQAVIAAIDDAIVDEMDILNLSLGNLAVDPWNAAGASCGMPGDSPCDPVAAAAQSAVVHFGRVVVAAAGNEGTLGLGPGPAKGTMSSPAVAPDVIAVAATANAVSVHETVSVGSRSFEALSGTGPGLLAALTAPASLAVWLGDQSACGPFETGTLNGEILVAERGGCLFATKVDNAARAGASAVVVYNDEPLEPLIGMSLLADTDIPAYFVSAESGEELEGIVREAGRERQTSITLDPTPVTSDRDWREPARYSSRGPSPGLNLKPDIAAPGDGIYSAGAYQYERLGGFNPSGFRRFEGTSAATPVIAGAAALVWQRHPEMTAREIASALINTASSEVLEEGETARSTTVGAGLLDLPAALDPIATVVPPTVGFGVLSERSAGVWQEIRITNHGAAQRRYQIRVVPRDIDARAGVTVNGLDRIELALGPGRGSTVRVALEGNRPLPGSYEGHLLVQVPGETRMLRVPYLYVVGDGVPHDAVPVSPAFTRGLRAEVSSGEAVARFVDRFGVAVAGAPVEFRVTEGGAKVLSADRRTDDSGVAGAVVEFGPGSDLHEVVAVVGGIELPFGFEATRERPAISGVYNSASQSPDQRLTPGSLATIVASGLGDAWGDAPAAPLPVALKGVSVSFDNFEADVSAPGRVFIVRPGEIGVQVPWELAGLNFAHAKVRVTDRSGDQNLSEPVVLDLSDVSPALYSVRDGIASTSAWHPDWAPVTRLAPASPGDSVLLQMTGAGPFEDTLASGEAFEDSVPLANDVEVTIDGRQATVRGHGSVPGVAGVAMVEVVVPRGTRQGSVEVVVVINGIASAPGTLPVG